MDRFVAAILALLLCASASAAEKPLRPKILGIAALHFYTTNPAAARRFYSQITDPSIACNNCEGHAGDPIVIRFPSGQWVTFTTAKNTPPHNLLAEVVFATDNVKGMREYLKAQGVAVESQAYPVPSLPNNPSNDCEQCGFTVTDPDGHRMGFVRVPPSAWASPHSKAPRVIHVGFVVHDRLAEDHFYKDLLGFHLYWHGGMKDDEDRWVAMQVPDGTDWIEYMLNIAPDASHHTLGVMNHMAIGVEDIHATEKQIVADGGTITEEPKIGRDGKWQLNLYDPDDTRTEFMEFTPKEKPCCNPFTGPHPGPQAPSRPEPRPK